VATSSLSAPSRPAQSKAKSTGKDKCTISRWPHDFYVSEIADGLDQLKAMKDANKKSNLVMNFQEVFGLPYHKTTFAKYKGWMESDDKVIQDIIEAFVSEGAVDDSLWLAFADAVKDRIAVLGKEDTKENESNAGDILDDAKSTSRSEDSALSHSHGDETGSDDEITTQCPYCDEHLPSSLTQQLMDMWLPWRRNWYRILCLVTLTIAKQRVSRFIRTFALGTVWNLRNFLWHTWSNGRRIWTWRKSTIEFLDFAINFIDLLILKF
jgi:hypothetical protein